MFPEFPTPPFLSESFRLCHFFKAIRSCRSWSSLRGFFIPKNSATGQRGIFSLIYTLLQKSRKGFFIALAISSWFSIVMGASAAAIELAISGTSPLKIALTAMAGIHAIIGVGEAIITTAAISLILKTRPDLVTSYAKKGVLHEKTT